MLNLKKGLALVLAAATAFTFAPVAQLGAPVQALAEDDETSETFLVEKTLDADTVYGFDLSASDKNGEKITKLKLYPDNNKNKDAVEVTLKDNGTGYLKTDANGKISSGTAVNETATGAAAKTEASVGDLFSVTANAAGSQEYGIYAVGATGTIKFDLNSYGPNGDQTPKSIASTTKDAGGSNTSTQTGSADKAISDKLVIPDPAYANTESGTDAGASFTAEQLGKDGFDNIIRLADGTGFYIKGLKLKGQNDHTYAVSAPVDGLTFFINQGSSYDYIPDYTGTTTDSADDVEKENKANLVTYTSRRAGKVNGWIADGKDNTVTLDVLVRTSGDHEFTLADRTKIGQGGKSNAEINFNIVADDKQKITDLDIVERKTSRDQTAAGYSETNLKSIKNTDNELYEMKLNNSDLGYDVTGLKANTKDAQDSTKDNAKKVQTWTGVVVNAFVDIDKFSDNPIMLEDTDTVRPGPKFTFSAGTAKDSEYYNSDGTRYSVKPAVVTAQGVRVSLKIKAYTLVNGTAHTVATTSLPITVDRSEEGIDSITYTDKWNENHIAKAGEYNGANGVFYANGYELTSDKAEIKNHPLFTVTGLNVQVNNSGKFTVAAEAGTPTFRSEDSTIVTINDKGEFQVVGVGKTTIHITTNGTTNNEAVDARINLEVNDWALDHITAGFENSDSGVSDLMYLDVSTQTKGKPVFEGKLNVNSAGDLKWTAEQSEGSSDVFTFTKNADGTITVKSGAKAGTGTITITSETDKARRIQGNDTTVTVRVWNVPAAEYTKQDIILQRGDSKLLSQYIQVTNPANASISWDYPTVNVTDAHYNLSNPSTGGLNGNLNTQTTSRITATSAGQSSVKATIAGVPGVTRPTVARLNVAVVDSSNANVIVLGDTKSLTLTEGDAPVTVTATSSVKAPVEFTSSDASVATVTAGATSGSAIVTAVKAGQTTIKVTSEGAETVEIPVVVSAKSNTAAEVKVPGKVSKIKLYQVKGAKLKINYSKIKGVAGYKVVYKYKKNGKQVRKTYVSTAGSKTVSVPKNTSVKVWVRAYNVNASGQRVNGAYKTATKKTDKK